MEGLTREILDLTLEHLWLVFVAMMIAGSVGIGGGILLTRRPSWRGWILGFANVMQTVPSLALFGFLIPIPFIGGIGKHTAILALVLYAILPVLRNTVAGIQGVDPAVIEAARGMGMTHSQALLRVQLPLASPLIFAGLRTTLVLVISTATLGNFIGAQGLGDVIASGINISDRIVFLGAVMVATLALLADWALSLLEGAVVPRRTAA